MAKFIKVTAINCVPAEYGPLKPNSFYQSEVIKYRAESVGIVFLNPDFIYEVSTEDMPGIGRVTHIYDADCDSTMVAESLEEVMLQIEGSNA